MRVRKGGAWRSIVSGYAYINGAWRQITHGKAYKGGAWRSVANFTTATPTSPFSVSASSTAIAGANSGSSVTSSPVTITPSGGLSPYTYAWAIVSSDGLSYTINSPASATTSVTGQIPSIGLTGTVVIKCTCRDSSGLTATSPNITIELTRTGPTGGGGAGGGGGVIP